MAPKQDPKPKFQEGKIPYRKALDPLKESSVVRCILSFIRAKEAGAATAQWRVCTAKCAQKSSFLSKTLLIAYFKLCRIVYQRSSACTIARQCFSLYVTASKHARGRAFLKQNISCCLCSPLAYNRPCLQEAPFIALKSWREQLFIAIHSIMLRVLLNRFD